MTRKLSLILIVLALAALIAPVASAGLPVSLITNAGFESKSSGTPALGAWTLTNGSGDKIVCGSKANKIAGDCAFKFKGGADEASVLSQSLANPSSLNNIIATQHSTIYFMFRYIAPNPATKLKTTLKVEYIPAGSTTPIKFKHSDLSYATSDWGYAGSTYAPSIPQGANLLKVAISIKNMSGAGKMFIDNVELSLMKNIA